MKILAIHNFHRKGSASGDDQVFKSETALLESHGNQVIRYTVSNDEFDNAGVIGKLSATFGMLWSSKNYKAVQANYEATKGANGVSISLGSSLQHPFQGGQHLASGERQQCQYQRGCQ